MTQRSRINWALIGVLVFSLLFSSSAISFADTDLTDKVQLVKSRLRYDPIALLSHLDVSLKNISQDVLSTPIKVVIESISDSSVTVANGDGTTDVGKPYFEYVTDSGVLSPDQTTDSKRWVFSNPDRKRFRYTISVTAKLPGPAVTISADPDTIEVGESSTLIWSSTNTDSCVIAPGIGTVDVDGSITVSPADNTMYTITATGPGGTAVATVTVNVTPAPLSITITSPTDATEFTQAPITVTGRVSRPGATVLVNGIEASVVDNEFMAEDVPLTVGSNAITAVVEEGTDTAAETITVFLMNIDLEPFQVEITSLTQDAQSLKVAGEVTVTVVNNGSGDVTGAYQVVLFEDTNVSGAYEEATDNVLGEASIASGPEAGGAMDVSMEFVGEILFRDNLIHVFVDSANDLEETDEANNVAGNQRCGVDLSASLLRLDDTACPDLVTLTVRMGNGGTAVVGPGVSVAFYDGEPENAGALIGTALTTETLEPGHYEDLAFEWKDPANGMRTIYARVDDDGTGAGILDETDKENNLVFCDMAICTAPPVPDSISGVVMDAVTAALLAGVDVILHADEAGGPGAVIDEYTTEEHGGFVFTGLDPGTYVLAASLQGYSTANRQVVLASGQGLTHQDLVLSPVLGPEQNRIVLTWGDAPGDLEAHLTGPNPEGCRHHCFYWHRDIPGASLDVDDTDSYGPETITITERTAGTYRFYVHDFTNRQSGTSQALSHSGAQVKVYFGSGKSPLVFRVPSRAGTVWHVFDLDGETGEVAPINRMTFQDHPGRIDFPVITSSAVTNATWGAGYTYQVEAVDPDTDSLTYSLLEHPEGMSVDPATGMIQWTPAGGQGGRFDVAVRVTDGRCGEDTQAFSVYVTYMPVVRFDVEPCSGFNPGGEITLSWDTERAETLMIDHGIGEVSSGGSLAIPSPAEPISYTMTATNGAGQVEKTAPAKPRVAFRADPYSISPGGSATLTWDCQCALTCEINQGIGDVPFNGTLKVTPTGTTTYTITATNGAGSTTQQVKVTVLVCTVTKAQITTVPICQWTAGDPAALTWNTQCALTCEIDQGIGEVAVNGSLVVTPTEPTMYTLSANGPAGSATASVNVPNLRPLGISFFNASPAYLLPGESSVLTWNSPCADTCTLDQGLGEVATSGTLIVTPLDLPTTYTITATSESETVTKSVTIRHSYPNATFGVSPGIIKKADFATLTWATRHATSCTIEPDIGDVPLSGSITVEPEKNTTYTLTVQGPGGTITRRATVSFVKPTAQIQAEPESIAEGASSTLSWVFSNADTCTIDPDIGDVQLGGSVSVTPDRTTTYTITAIGPGGTAGDSVRVTVIYLEPTVNTGAEPLMVVAGESSTLSWTSTHADACFIEPGIGSVDVNGSIAVSPFTTTTYTVTATGRGGVATADVTVTVIHPPSITVLEPNGMADTACDSFTIQWTDADYDDDATISLYYDIDNSGENGTLIVSGLSEDPDGQGDDQYVWDTAEIVEGAYYVFAVIDDGVHDPVVDYSDGVVTIVHTLPDETKLTAGDAAASDRFAGSVSISGNYAIVGAYRDDDAGNDSGSAYIFKRRGMTWTEQAKLTAGDAAASDRFAGSVSISGNYAIVGAYRDDDGGSDSGSAYIFKRDGTTWTQQAKLTAGDAAASDWFGWSVSISGNYAIVGANGDDDGGSSSGSAYIFKRDGTIWTQQAKLTASDAAASDWFGESVSISGDYAVIGACCENDGGSYSGAAYIFKREGSSWAEQAKLTASDAATSDYFGYSVSINGDTAIVGANGDDDAGNSSGAAYIFKLDGTTWTQQAKLTASDAAESDYFGESVSISGDTAIVGAYGDDDGGNASGAAYIFKRDGTTWAERAKLTASDAAASDFFGCSVTVGGGSAIVGANGNGGGGSYSGSAYVYPLCTVDISAHPEVVEIGASTTLRWTSNEAESLDIDQGVGSVPASGSMIVSPQQTITYTITATGLGGPATDSVTVSTIDPSVPATVSISASPETIVVGQSSILSWISTNAQSVTIDDGIGDVPLNGALIVTPAETTTYTITATSPGGMAAANIMVTVIHPPSITVVEPDGIEDNANTSFTIQWTDADPDDDATISLYYDINSYDSNGTLIVSGLSEDPDEEGNDEYVWDTTEIAEGLYYVYAVIDDGVNDPVVDYSAGKVTIDHTLSSTEAKLTASDAAASDWFGWSVSISGDYAIVGAEGDDDAGISSGSAYIFKREGTSWTEQAKLTAGDAAAYDRFGWSVSISGDYAVIGAYGDGDAGIYSGSAYIFKREGTTWTEQAKLTASDAAARDYFGWSVSISGDYAIVGAYGYSDAEYDAGAAYIFKREGTTWTEQAKLTASDAAARDYFGWSVSISGDYAVIGAYCENDGGSYSGAAYIFKREGTTWAQQAKLTASDAAARDYFGYSVSISGDYAVIGAYGDDDDGGDSGAAYIFKREGMTWTEQAKLTAGDAGAYDDFGRSVSISGDCVVIGAYGDDDDGGDSGAAYIFKREGTTWTEQAKLNANYAVARDDFGFSVSVSGGYGIVGAYGDDDGGSDSGSAYIYSISTVNIIAYPESILIGESSTLSWSSINVDSLGIDQGIGSVSADGSMIVSPEQTTTYTITATGPGGTFTDSVTVNVIDPSLPATVSMSANPETIQVGESATLTWSSTNADSCVIEPDIGSVGLGGSMVVSLTESTTYTITATGPGGTATASVTVTVTHPALSVSISANPETILVGESATLSWTSTNADSCVIEPDVGTVDRSGSTTVSPTETTTYTITATGPGGTATASVTVTVTYPAPTVSISADPETILLGESTSLTWSSTDADTCVIEPDVGTVDPSGSTTVSPVETTTYTITATGPGGTAAASVTVTVTHPAPTVSISADPITLQVGESSILTWSSTNADSCVIEPDVGSVAASGSVALWPDETTIYVIRATGPGGTATATVRIYVTSAGEYLYGNPTPAEQAHLEAINRARLDPQGEAARLGIDLNEGLPEGTISGYPVQPLTFNAQLHQAAGLHSRDMIDQQYYGHDSLDGRTPFDRIEQAGYQYASAAENIANTVSDAPLDETGTMAVFHDALFIDEDTEGRGHRINILYGDFKEVGLAAAPGACDGYPYCYKFTCNFASSWEPDSFLLGVVYDDQDSDGIYDAGEGIGGVEIVVVESGTQALTASAGGYAIALPPGDYTLQATLPDGRGAERDFSMRHRNMKVDFLLSDFSFPPPSVTISADPQTVDAGASFTLKWSSANADFCAIEPDLGTVDLSGSITLTPTETTTYSVTATGPGGASSDIVTVCVYDPFVPLGVSMSTPSTSISQGDSSVLSWSSTNAHSVYIDNGIGEVSLNGSVTVYPEHTTSYRITVTGSDGSVSAQSVVKVTGNPEPQPEGSFGKRYEDLVPPDATVQQYDANRFSLITGLVQDLAGSPISDVSVTILHHPEYGTVSTDTDGRFSIPVEGGATMTFVYQKDGLLTSQRQVYCPWNDIAIAETIVMIAEDPVSTTVTFDGSPDTVVTHRSTEVTDEFGTRSCTMVFSGDNLAYLLDEDGNDIHALTTITTRATEYTTLESMPAILPPTSAYTYCVELSVDGAQRVRFDKPVIIWVDNFIGFDVGEIVPVGYYDRDRGVWVPSDNGVVVRLLDTNSDGVVDGLDADGDGQPNDLNGSGSYSDEVTGIDDPTPYPPGSTFWRVAINHFTPVDENWGYGPPEDAILPNPTGEPDADQQKPEDCITPCGSFVEDRSRIFHEDIPIPGTDMTLHYASNRVQGYKTVITVPASGETVPSSLNAIIVKVEVAGRTLEETLDPLPNQKAEFVWDGLDHLGRPVNAATTARVSIGFAYKPEYYSSTEDQARAFAQVGGSPTGDVARQCLVYWKHSSLLISRGWGEIAEGWTLSAHHRLFALDPYTLFKGDGTILRTTSSLILTICGDTTPGYSGDEGSATHALIRWPSELACDASGNLYIADQDNHCVRKIDTNGIITTVAGTGEEGYGGDGGPATKAQLSHPVVVEVDRAGNFYISEYANHCIRKVDTNGIITTVVGTGKGDYSGDDGPATSADLYDPCGLAVDDWGNLYVADENNDRIRKIDAAGKITTVVGGGNQSYDNAESPTDVSLTYPTDVVLDSSGNLYIADALNHVVAKMDTSGKISIVAGRYKYSGYAGDGGPAVEARLNWPVDIDVDALGNLYIAERYNHCIRKVDTSGIITTVAGTGTQPGYYGDWGPPTNAYLAQPLAVAVDASDNVYIADAGNHCIRKVFTPRLTISGMGPEDIGFVEENGLAHVVSGSGLHKKTIDLDTGVVVREFAYDEDNKLVSITDRFGNEITINVGDSITSPDGLATILSINDSHLTRITYPDGSFYRLEYDSEGLLTAKVEPEGNRFDHQFDPNGRLTKGSDWHLSRTVHEYGDILAEVTSGEGNATSYLDHTYSTGKYTSTITDPTGAETLFDRSANELSVNKSLACGMELDFEYDINPEYLFKYVKKMTESTPSGLEKVTFREKTYEVAEEGVMPDRVTEQITVNEKTTTHVTDLPAATKTLTSSEGRTVTALCDPGTFLTTNLSIPGLYDTTYGYDTSGRLTSMSTNTRQTSFFYNGHGFLESVTDPENYTTTYTHDAVGRVTGISRPDGASLGFTYDANGNMTVLTNPSTINHGFGYNSVNLNSSYQTPISGSYSYVYDNDRRLVQTNFPSGNQINNIYDTTMLVQIQTPEGNIDYTYLCGTKVESIASGTDTITYGYDGKLLTSETLSGTLSESLGYTYYDDFNLQSFTYAGNTHIYMYDDDDLLAGTGRFGILRNAGNGLTEAVTSAELNLTRTFNGYGEVEDQDFTVSESSITSWSLTRDNTGRITAKTETVDATTSDYAYTYDPMGRLLTVTKGGTLVEEYQYGPNGTRIYEMNSLKGISGRAFQYSDEDHLLTAGDTTYEYNLDGFLTTKTQGTDVTTYNYSCRGELLSVTLPDGTVIDYGYDPLGRRIARVVNGITTEKYLWQGLTRLLAVYDGSDNLVMRFEYADGRMPVAVTKDGSTYYLTYDQVGSLKVIANTSGNVVKTIEYDSFGNIINDTALSFEIPFGFAGGLHDRDTGLVRFGYRDYDPDVGRWTAKDPILFAGGDTDLYGYCLSDPINLIDPEGLWIPQAIAAVAVATFAYQAYKAAKKADEARTIRDKVYDEIDKGVPDPEYAEKLKEDADKTYNEFLDEMKETVKKGMKVPHVSTCP